MSAKKQGNKAAAAPVVVAKPKKVNPATKIKRNEDGSKIMKVARGTARAVRREDLIKGWKNVASAKKMAPAATEAAAA